MNNYYLLCRLQNNKYLETLKKWNNWVSYVTKWKLVNFGLWRFLFCFFYLSVFLKHFYFKGSLLFNPRGTQSVKRCWLNNFPVVPTPTFLINYAFLTSEDWWTEAFPLHKHPEKHIVLNILHPIVIMNCLIGYVSVKQSKKMVFVVLLEEKEIESKSWWILWMQMHSHI